MGRHPVYRTMHGRRPQDERLADTVDRSDGRPKRRHPQRYFHPANDGTRETCQPGTPQHHYPTTIHPEVVSPIKEALPLGLPEIHNPHQTGASTAYWSFPTAASMAPELVEPSLPASLSECLFFFDFSFRIMTVNICRTDLEPGQSLLAPAASCTRCQTPAAELSNLAQDQSSLSPQFEKTGPQPLSVHEIYVLRCFLRSYRPTRRFTVQSFPYRASVPCKNGPSCLFHLQQRCWFRHENAQTEAQTQTEEYDENARSCERPSNEYNELQERVRQILPKNESTKNYAEVRAHKMSKNTTNRKSQFESLDAVQPVTKVCNPHVSRSTSPAQIELNSSTLSTKAVAYDRQPTRKDYSETEYNNPISSTKTAACDRQLKWGDYSEAEPFSICQADDRETTPTSYQDPSGNQEDHEASEFIKRSIELQLSNEESNRDFIIKQQGKDMSNLQELFNKASNEVQRKIWTTLNQAREIRKKHERRERKTIVHARDRDFDSLCDLHHHIVSLQAIVSQHGDQLQSLWFDSQRCRILHDSNTSRQDIIDEESLDFEYNFITMMYCERSLIKLPNNT